MRRPFTPPRALMYLKYASGRRPTDPYDAAIPDSGMVPPITISPDPTPGSAIGRADAAPAASANASVRAATRRMVAKTENTTELLGAKRPCAGAHRGPSGART